jgi:hypothetical protein
MVRRQLGIYPTLYLNVSIDGVIESEVETAEDLKIALESGKYVRLANDIDLSGTAVSVPYNEKASVDLNGKTLTLGLTSSDGNGCIFVYGTLTIKDSSTNKVGKIAKKTGTGYPLVYVQSLYSNYLANLTFDGITVNAPSCIFSYVKTLSYLNIKDCVFNCSGSYIVQAYGSSYIDIDGEDTSISASRIIDVQGKPTIYIRDGELNSTYGILDNTGSTSTKTTLYMYGGSLNTTDFPIRVLNSSVINIEGGNISGSACFLFGNGTFNMSGGSLNCNNQGVTLYGTSKATISGDAQITARAHAIWSFSSGKIEVSDKAELTSTVTGNQGIFADSTSTCAIEILGKAKVSGTNAILANGANDIDIKGGTLTGTNSGIFAICKNATGSLTIDIEGDNTVLKGGLYGIVGHDYNIGTAAYKDDAVYPVVTIKGGSITAGGGITADKNYKCYALNMSTNKGSFKMTGGSISSAGYGVALLGYPTATIEGGKIEAEAFALAGNGTYYSDRVDYKISGGELISTNAYAIYLPNATTTEISGTAKISGWGAVDLQRGNLSISDSAELTADAAEAATIPATGDGTAGLQFAAVNISARYGDLTLNITGGKFTARNYASIIDNTYNGALTSNSKTVNITGGYFSSDPSSVAIKTYSSDYTVISTKDTNFLSSDYKAVETTDGYYQVVAATAE